MAIHMTTQVEGEQFNVTLSTDDAGHYVAEAARFEHGMYRTPVQVRIVDTDKERAILALFQSLRELVVSRLEQPGGAAERGPHKPLVA
jgi:hypothetical protein